MKTKPILFSGEMVRAILDGRKSQTRRVCKFTSGGHLKGPRTHKRWHPDDPNAVLACPYGVPGDQLWVKETWRVHENHDALRPRLVVSAMGGDYRGCVDYLATPGLEPFWGKTRVSLFMPPEFSRITLEITGVRVERLNAISEEDAAIEGYPWASTRSPDTYDPIEWYRGLWDEINGAGSWALNPWVWVLEFRRVTP